MLKPKTSEPIYTEKVEMIFQSLERGASKAETAEKFQYSRAGSMDTYMKRKNFLWDKRKETYVPMDVFKASLNEIEHFPTDKVRRVVKGLEKEGATTKEVALKVGFSNHMEMADYMRSKQYEWSKEAKNYRKVEVDVLMEDSPKVEKKSSSVENVYVPGQHALLEWLAANREALEDLLKASEETEKIPRFAFQGTLITKSVHMKNTLDQLVRDYSQEKKINQREIFEVALIEFFQKYGYTHEIELLFKQGA